MTDKSVAMKLKKMLKQRSGDKKPKKSKAKAEAEARAEAKSEAKFPIRTYNPNNFQKFIRSLRSQSLQDIEEKCAEFLSSPKNHIEDKTRLQLILRSFSNKYYLLKMYADIRTNLPETPEDVSLKLAKTLTHDALICIRSQIEGKGQCNKDVRKTNLYDRLTRDAIPELNIDNFNYFQTYYEHFKTKKNIYTLIDDFTEKNKPIVLLGEIIRHYSDDWKKQSGTWKEDREKDKKIIKNNPDIEFYINKFSLSENNFRQFKKLFYESPDLTFMQIIKQFADESSSEEDSEDESEEDAKKPRVKRVESPKLQKALDKRHEILALDLLPSPKKKSPVNVQGRQCPDYLYKAYRTLPWISAKPPVQYIQPIFDDFGLYVKGSRVVHPALPPGNWYNPSEVFYNLICGPKRQDGEVVILDKKPFKIIYLHDNRYINQWETLDREIEWLKKGRNPVGALLQTPIESMTGEGRTALFSVGKEYLGILPNADVLHAEILRSDPRSVKDYFTEVSKIYAYLLFGEKRTRFTPEHVTDETPVEKLRLVVNDSNRRLLPRVL